MSKKKNRLCGTMYTRKQIENILDYIQKYPITGPFDIFNFTT